jgi:hypothetical protein
MKTFCPKDMKTQEQAFIFSLWDKPQKHNCYFCPRFEEKTAPSLAALQTTTS